MPDIITLIPTMTDDKLSELFKNVCKKLANGSDVRAPSVKAAIENEWKRRRDLCLSGDTWSTRPKKGMLAELGYRVGENGEKTAVRRKILARAVEDELLMVGSPAYTAEWGAPNSSRRYQKLTNILQSQITNPAHANKAKAKIEWIEDLEWVEQNFGHLSDRVPLQPL